MSQNQIDDLSQSQRDRLAYIDLRLRYFGEIRRQDLVTRFDVQVAAATRDIALYKGIAPRNLEYDSKGKIYVRGQWFNPVFDFQVDRILTWLSQGYGDSEPIKVKPMLSSESPSLINKPDLDALSAITRAIYSKKGVEIAYRSLSSGLSTREIVPFALADNGLRWHVRAYDRRSNEFRDFVLARIEDAKILDGAIQDAELQDQDIQWNRIVEIELVPHPANVQYPDTVEAEYGMANGALVMRARAAMVGYLLRRWNVDCTENHSLKGSEYHLWLRNRQALYGVTNLVLAPGYES